MSVAARSPVLVGRRAELATARGLVDALLRGRGATMLVTGEAGIGKSRLLAEVAARAVTAGVVVLEGRAVEGGGTYRPVAEALARPLRELPLLERARLRPFRSALRRVVPGSIEVDDAAGALQGPVPDPTVVLGEGVLALLRELGGTGCALLLEDLHWADADTLALVSYLADAIPGTPVLLGLTARDDAPAPSSAAGSTAAGIAALTAHPGVTALRLTRMDGAEVAALAAACRGGVPLAEAELRSLVARSDGLPFLVEELLDPDGSAAPVPPTLAGLVARRLAALPEAGRPVLVAAAVAAGDPDRRLLSAVTGAPEAIVLDALRAAAEVGLLAADAGQLRWRHALTRDAVLATLLPPERAALAARTARALEERGEPGDGSAAAELFVAADERRRAVEILVGLARRDAARGALHSAEELLHRADELSRARGLSTGTVVTERVRVLTLLGRVADALEVGGAALDDGSVTGDEHAELCLGLARAAVAGGRWAAAESWLERAGRPADPRSRVLAADAAFGAGDVSRAAALARAVVDAVEQAAGPHGALKQGSPAHDSPAERAALHCEALVVLARSDVGTDFAAASAAFRRAAQVAAEHALTPWRVEALFGSGSIELTEGNPSAPSLAAARELAVQCGMLAQAVQADVVRSDAVLLVHGARAARPLAELAAERAGRLRLSALQAMAELMTAADAAMAGQPATMAAMLEAAGSRPDAPPEVRTLAPVVRGLPHVLGHDLPRAAALFDEGICALLPHGSAAPTQYFGLWALLRTAVGDRDQDARATLRGHHTLCAAPNRGALAYAEAIAAGRAGSSEGAAGWFAEAEAVMATMPWWNRLLRLLALEAAVADGWGDPVPALRADLAAHEQAEEPALARTCRDLLRAAGAPTRRGRGSAPVPPVLRSRGITAREADVLALVTEGLTNAEIAARLVLSRRTVETHVARLLAKTGTAVRGELRAWAVAHRAPPLTP